MLMALAVPLLVVPRRHLECPVGSLEFAVHSYRFIPIIIFTGWFFGGGNDGKVKGLSWAGVLPARTVRALAGVTRL